MNFLDESRNPQITSCQRRLTCRPLVERDLSGLTRRACEPVGDHEVHSTALQMKRLIGGTFVSPAAAAGAGLAEEETVAIGLSPFDRASQPALADLAVQSPRSRHRQCSQV